MFLHVQTWAFMLLQGDQPMNFDLMSMWGVMAWPARIVVIVLFLMSAWSIGVGRGRQSANSSAAAIRSKCTIVSELARIGARRSAVERT